jgi:hypothetical protein
VVSNQTARLTEAVILGPFEREFLCGATGVLPQGCRLAASMVYYLPERYIVYE